jgi:hypothetical protein
MSRTVLLALLAALLSTATGTDGLAAEAPITAHLRTLDEGRRGAELRVRLELSWAGRPEQHIAHSPTIEVPPGAALRPGLSRSRFDGNSTRWSHDVVVTLPDRPGPWTIGPARITLDTPGQEDREVAAAAIRTGRPSRFRHLAGQAAGNGIVLALALWFGLGRYRRLRDQEAVGDAEISALLVAARNAAEQQPETATTEALLQALLEVALALEHGCVENGALWTSTQIRERLEQVKFAGEEIPADECLQMLRLFEAEASSQPQA